jgi:succinate dehydrogenase / fumarate reductase iron-sulfur subunit
MTENEAPEPVSSPATLVLLRVRRQESVEQTRSHWDHFQVELPATATVADALSAVERNPKTVEGKRVAPIDWDGDCLEGACGACTMRVNGKVALACTTLVEPLSRGKKPLLLEPLSRFAVVRDLVVDRSPLWAAMAQVEAASHIPDPAELPPLPVAESRTHERLLGCMGCGACAEACPQYGPHSDFLGAAALNHAHGLNLTPDGALRKSQRLRVLMAPGGVADCGKAQNCVEVCPAKVPLVDSLTTLSRQTSLRFLFDWLGP